LRFYQSLAGEQEKLFHSFTAGCTIEEARPRLVRFLEHERADLSSDAEFIGRALLGPWTEAQPLCSGRADNECPACGNKPQAALLIPEFDGLRRRLACSVCWWEWDFRRILCPDCGETDFDRLPSWQAEKFPHLRLDACESCKAYLVTADLSRDKDAIALVDDLAALTLHFWAAEQGYRRLEPNLFRV
jgi:formate dehydrogenase accessory protein FdhE